MAELGNMTVKIDVDDEEAQEKLVQLGKRINALTAKGLVEQEVTRQLSVSPQMRLKLAGKSLLLLANIVSFVGIFYFFLSGYPHVFAGNATGSQPTLGFLCVIVFLFLFLTAIQMSPNKTKERK